jgi:membrane protein
MIVIAISSVFFDQQIIIEKLTGEMAKILGDEAAVNFETILTKVHYNDDSFLTALVGIGSLLFGATGLFIQLQNAMNAIWGIQKKPKLGIKRLLKDRVTSLGLVLVVNFLLLLSLVISAILSALNDWIAHYLSEGLLVFSVILNLIISLFIITLLFAAIFKFLPDVEISWPMVWKGSLITAVLFTIGKELIALYIGYANPGSSFGAGGAIILFLLWIFYSCLILFFGAEFTQVYARWKGYHLQPSDYAMWIPARDGKNLDG